VTFDSYNGEPSISAFEWWNHWPVAQIPSSGRPALAADRPGHTSLSHIYWPVSAQDEQRTERLLMSGLTTSAAAALAPLAASWRSPARADISGGASIGYDARQRAYVIAGAGMGPLTITLHGSAATPIVNPAFVVEGWRGTASPSVTTGGTETPASAATGLVTDLRQTRLIVFLPTTSRRDVTIKIGSDEQRR
jgi:hypothetical protein